jgi:Leucine-rich repeat (LRR) protein
MKNLVFILALVLVSTYTYAQDAPLSPARLAKEPTFIYLKDALQTPLKVYKLNLSFNRLGTFPKEIGELKNLQELHSSSNQFSTLPKEIGELKNLRKLYLNENRLSTLPKEIGELKNLQSLDLKKNPISDTEKKRIQELLPECEIYF